MFTPPGTPQGSVGRSFAKKHRRITSAPVDAAALQKMVEEEDEEQEKRERKERKEAAAAARRSLDIRRTTGRARGERETEIERREIQIETQKEKRDTERDSRETAER